MGTAGSVRSGLLAPRLGRCRPATCPAGVVWLNGPGRRRPTLGVPSSPERALGGAPGRSGGLLRVRDRRRVVAVAQRVLDPARDLIDRLGVLADGVQRAVLAPAGDVGDRLAADVEPDGGADDVGDAVDEHLGLGATVLLVADAEGVRELVHERADLAVGSACGDDDLLVLVVAPAARAMLGEVADLDAIPELAPELLKRRDQVGVAVAFDRLRRRAKRDGL